MITKVKSFQASDGSICPSLEAAQQKEVSLLISGLSNVSVDPAFLEVLSAEIVKNADKLTDILTTKASSRPAQRKVNGGTKKKAKATPASTTT